MSEVLETSGLTVYSSDVYPRGYGDPEPFDFVNDPIPPDLRFDHVVTNPPYSLSYEFVDRALQIADQTVCMLMKLAFLETRKRWDLLAGRYPREAWVFTTRPHFTRNGIPDPKGSSMLAFAWFVWKAPFNRTEDTISVRHIFGGPTEWGGE